MHKALRFLVLGMAVAVPAAVLADTLPTLLLNGTEDIISSTPDIYATQTNPSGDTAVSFTLSSTDSNSNDLSGDINCTKDTDSSAVVSGSTFQVGTTTVTCTVADAAYATSTGQFHVGVSDLDSANSAAYNTSSQSTETAGTGGGDFSSGWSWAIHVTIPFEEVQLNMAFGTSFTDGDNTFPALDNVRIYSEQAQSINSAANAVTCSTDAGTEIDCPTVTIDSTKDADTSAAGRQVDIVVQVQIPESAPASSSYSNTWTLTSSKPAPPIPGGFH